MEGLQKNDCQYIFFCDRMMTLNEAEERRWGQR